jgi:hypothetical protein
LLVSDELEGWTTILGACIAGASAL